MADGNDDNGGASPQQGRRPSTSPLNRSRKQQFTHFFVDTITPQHAPNMLPLYIKVSPGSNGSAENAAAAASAEYQNAVPAHGQARLGTSSASGGTPTNTGTTSILAATTGNSSASITFVTGAPGIGAAAPPAAPPAPPVAPSAAAAVPAEAPHLRPAKRKHAIEPWESALMAELERSAREDPEDLWLHEIQKAENNRELHADALYRIKRLRKEYEDERNKQLRTRSARDHRWMIDQGVIARPTDDTAAAFPVAVDMLDRDQEGGQILFPKGYQMPSAGPAFDPPIRPMADFLVEVRADMETPMRPDALQPRGFQNPGNLCYRNAVVTALLNTDRFLSFLYTHARRIRTYINNADVNHHLLTRLYHLALAYWNRDGVHPMSRDGDESVEKLNVMFWRACKYGVEGEPMDEAGLASATAALAEGSGDPPKHPWMTKSWWTICQEQAAMNDRPLVLHDEQQDAAEFFDWLSEMAATQLHVAPERYTAAKSSDYYDCMFRTYLTTRFVCSKCHRPVRLRREQVERESSIKIQVTKNLPDTSREAKADDSPTSKKKKRIHDLREYLASYFNEEIEGMRCSRCTKVADDRPFRRMRRMQTAPEILNVHLMRADYDQRTGAVIKSNVVVDVPEFLDVSPWLEHHVFVPGTRILYRLTAVVSHHGATTHSGHYVSHVRSAGGLGVGNGSASSSGSADAAAVAAGGPTKVAIYGYDDAVRVMRQASERRDLVKDLYSEAHREIKRQREAGGSSHRGLSAKQKSKLYRDAERHNNGWIRLSDSRATPGIPYARIMNTTPDPTHTPKSRDWFDPVLLVYEKWVEKYVVDQRTGQRVYQVPMNLPGITRTRLNRKSVSRTAAAEAQIRSTAKADVQVPEKWPPVKVTGALPEIYRPGRGDYGVDEAFLGIVDDSEGEGEDEDGEDNAGDADAQQPAATRRLGARNMENFFGWGVYDQQAAEASTAEEKAENERKRAERAAAAAAAKTAKTASKRTAAVANEGAADEGSQRPAKKRRARKSVVQIDD